MLLIAPCASAAHPHSHPSVFFTTGACWTGLINTTYVFISVVASVAPFPVLMMAEFRNGFTLHSLSWLCLINTADPVCSKNGSFISLFQLLLLYSSTQLSSGSPPHSPLLNALADDSRVIALVSYWALLFSSADINSQESSACGNKSYLCTGESWLCSGVIQKCVVALTYLWDSLNSKRSTWNLSQPVPTVKHHLASVCFTKVLLQTVCKLSARNVVYLQHTQQPHNWTVECNLAGGALWNYNIINNNNNNNKKIRRGYVA